jgi:GTP-binding protein
MNGAADDPAESGLPGFDPADAEQQAETAEARRLLFARPWTFLTGVVAMTGLPPATGSEVAFAGRSNVGKSSLINALLGQAGLARTSNTPGRTQELNFFAPAARVERLARGEKPSSSKKLPADTSAGIILVDMPGYGYAQAPIDHIENWTQLVFDYLRGRGSLRRVYVLIDSRHGLKPGDLEVMDLLDQTAVSYQIVLTKVDKLGKTLEAAGIQAVIQSVEQSIRRRPAAHPVILATSSEKGWGIEAMRVEIAAFVS